MRHSESDKMDISEVSDQVSPVSDQSEVVDNQHPSVVAHPAQLDNASAIAAVSTNTTTTTTTTTMMGTTGVTTRGRLSSALSLEGLDLELPSLDMYQEEYAEFPSSPKHLKECLEAHGLSMPLERDSGTTGCSEEEEEDTSIYQAVLSPDCQDVRLRKDINNEKVTQDDIAKRALNKCKSAEILAKCMEKKSLRRILTPNPEDALLPNLDGVTESLPIVLESSHENSTKCAMNEVSLSSAGLIFGNKSKTLHCGNEINGSGILLHGSMDDLKNDSSFVFVRRNSKKFTREELGERVIEGIFIECREDQAIRPGLRKIPVPKDLELNSSPTHESLNPSNFLKAEDNLSAQCTSKDFNKWSEECHVKADMNGATIKPFHGEVSENLRKTNKPSNKPQPAARKSGLILQLENIMPIPAARTRSIDSINEVPFRTPPCPKPRRKYKENSKSRSSCLLLDPATLELRTPRAVPRINPDGSLEVQQERPGSLVASQCGGRRKIQVSADILNGPAEEDNISSGESRLSDTDMMSPDDDPDLDALLSPDLDTPDELEDSILERLGEPPPAPDPIPELSAAEERTEARSWRNCIVAGLERRIDMKVIEPYKRVLSHGGYLAAGSHNAIIVFSACFLPDRSRVDYDYVMDNLFLYVLTTLDQLITEDYVLIYLHGATARSCMPTFSWLKRCYQMIDRRLRKNLKGLYLVHPTFWLKTIVVMTRPFISSKFSRKLRFIESLSELAAVVPLEQASIPDRVKQLDLDQAQSNRKRILSWWSIQSDSETKPSTTTTASTTH